MYSHLETKAEMLFHLTTGLFPAISFLSNSHAFIVVTKRTHFWSNPVTDEDFR